MAVQGLRAGVLAAVLASLCAGAVCSAAAPEEPPAGCWITMPMPPRSSSVTHLAVDAKGTAWIRAGTACYYWDGACFQPKPPGDTALVRRVGEFTVAPEAPPGDMHKPGVFHLTSNINCPGYAGACRLFWRVKHRPGTGAPNGPWHVGEDGEDHPLALPVDGTFEVEYIALDPLGAATPEPVVVPINTAAPKKEAVKDQ